MFLEEPHHAVEKMPLVIKTVATKFDELHNIRFCIFMTALENSLQTKSNYTYIFTLRI